MGDEGRPDGESVLHRPRQQKVREGEEINRKRERDAQGLGNEGRQDGESVLHRPRQQKVRGEGKERKRCPGAGK